MTGQMGQEGTALKMSA